MVLLNKRGDCFPQYATKQKLLIMKKAILFAALSFILCVPSISAQGDKRECEKERKGKDHTARMEQTIKELGLDEKQAAEFREINQKYREQFKVERAEFEKQNQAHRERTKAIRDEQKTELKKILSDEQYEKLKETHRKNHKAHHKGRKGKSHHHKHHHFEKS